MLNNYKKTAGNTVIEILIATVIVAVVLTALAASMTKSIHNSAEAEYRQIAARMGQDVMEIFRQDKNIYPWDEFKAAVSEGYNCVPLNPLTIKSGFTQGLSSTATINLCPAVPSNNMTFQRAIQKQTVVSGTTEYVKITVTTAWNAADPARKRSVELQQVFYKPGI